MEVKSTVTYPYPIWGLYDDFKGEKPSGKRISISKDFESDSILLEYEILTKNDGIERLISDGFACLKCIVECSTTYYIQIENPEDRHFTISVPCNKVSKRFSVRIVIVATQPIFECNYLDVDDIYDSSVDFPKGAVIGHIDAFNVSLKACDNLADLTKVIKIMTAEVDSVENILSDRIVIKIPKGYAGTYDKAEGACPKVIEASLVRSALIQALCELKNYYEDEEKDWVFYLKQFISEMESAGEISIPENWEFEIKDVFDIVDAILPNVLLEAMTDVKSLTE